MKIALALLGILGVWAVSAQVREWFPFLGNWEWGMCVVGELGINFSWGMDLVSI